ncbi:FecR family protein [Pedobacter sp. MC2016-24]|uniref:FecR family protein n=1 Tax=Pedobacter sp. MC2016-24 TaxID=2780090 RepID=UPI00187EB0A5|nr:FecR family protein [Pedobacter sp. MC2016-24]MBE9600335.1 FecR domain-containing protein [Pedobacter sp. MC2016-24]
MEKPVIQLFKNFILNRCSTEEIAQVQELIRSGGYEAEWREAMETSQALFTDGKFTEPELNEAELLQKIKQKIALQPDPVKKHSWKWLGIAAAVLLVGSLAVWLNQPAGPKNETSMLKTENPVKHQHTAHKWIKLPDGSSVQLNQDSHLEYADSFEGKALREVTLIGEGYFDIKHDPKHPFVIHTGKIKTTVLGTAFNIKADAANQLVVVTVTRGKVKVEDEQKTLAVLTPDQQLSWNAKAGSAVKLKVNAVAALEWKKHDLIMDDITLAEAAGIIAERYAVKVQFENEKVKACRFTAAFLNKNDISQVLKVVGEITGATLTLKDNLVQIDGPGC